MADKNAVARWIENDAQWYEQRMVHCACCGRLIAKHFLVAETEVGEQVFCGEECAELHRSYVVPVRGDPTSPAAGMTDRYEGLMAK